MAYAATDVKKLFKNNTNTSVSISPEIIVPDTDSNGFFIAISLNYILLVYLAMRLAQNPLFSKVLNKL